MSADLLVYLAAAVVCVPLAKRLGLGSILGYLVAGALIGPQLLGLVAEPEAAHALSELGVVLMLFAIGLELEVGHLWGMRRAVFGGGALQLGACGAALGLTLFALGVPWQGALIAGLALGLSSTAIAVQTMDDRAVTKTPMGRTAFAILLFQDMAAIPLLALAPILGMAEPGGVDGHGDMHPAWLNALEALGALALVIVVGRYLVRHILRPIASTGVREIFTAFALLLVLGVGELMHLAGLSMALGAFLAGVMLASSEYRHALETDLEPFKGLLLGLFFIAVGMSIDFSLLATRPGEILLLLTGFVVVKLGTLWLVSRWLHVERRERWLFAALIGQGGEFAFVVFGVARTVHLLPGDWDALLTLTVALSMASTPILLIVHDHLTRLRAKQTEATFDTITDEGAEVLVAGFGRFGQIVGRFLFASGIKATVLDADPVQIEFLRRFGFRVFYGDATRIDLLEHAGLARAKVVVVAIAETEASVSLARRIRERYPDVTIVARARDVSHFAALRRAGADVVERETFEGSLLTGRRVLEHLGCPPFEARERADKFRRHNQRTLEALLPTWDDEQRRIQVARQAREELEEQFERDREAAHRERLRGWHAEPVPDRDAESET